MLKKHSQIFEGLFTASDVAVVSLAWILSYYVRFQSGLFAIEKGIPPFVAYLKMLVFVWAIWMFVYRRFGLYKPMRGVSRTREIFNVIRANSFSVLILLAVTYLFQEKNIEFSRGVFIIFGIISTVFSVASRSILRTILRMLRKKGYNKRHVIIVGAGELARKVFQRIAFHPEYGVNCIGCLASSSTFKDNDIHYRNIGSRNLNKNFRLSSNAQPQFEFLLASDYDKELQRDEDSFELPILGTYDQLPEFISKASLDQVIIAMPFKDHAEFENVINSVTDEIVDVRIVPDIHQFIQLGSLIEEFDGLPVVSMASTPLSGFNVVLKRAMDLIFGSIFVVLSLPILLISALLVKITSKGPIFYSQQRVGLDGKHFNIYKFRTMYCDAEKGGAKFAVRNDPRVTPVGRFMRKFNVDEVPQLINVIKGQMSLVGPRPERQVFIDEFRKNFPKYMLRHKVQAGMTGWAQVNGWRGNTSIKRRIEHDLYYIENWSLMFDLKILVLTFFNSFTDRNAY